MNLADARLAPATGADGLVARTMDAVLFVAARTPVEEVGRLVATVSAHDEPTPGRTLARQLATVVGADQGTLPGFALVASSAGGTYIKVYGPVEVRVESTEGNEEVISGVGSLTGVDRELVGSFHTIVAHRAGDPVPGPVFDVDVRAGTTPGDGFSLTTLTGPTDAPTPHVPPTNVPVDGTEEAPAPGTSPAYEAATRAWSAEEVAEAAPPAAEPTVAPASEAPPAAAEPTVAPASEAPPAAAAPAWDPPANDPPRAQEAPVSEPVWEVPVAEPPPVAEDASVDALASPPASGAPLADPVEAPPVAEPPWSEPATDGAPVVDAASAPPAEPDHDHGHGHELDQGQPGVAGEPATLPPSAIPAGGFTSHLLGALDEEEEVEEREPLPVVLDPAEVRAPDDEATPEIMVQGVLCSRGHFNDPRSRFCSSCGIGMVQNTQVLAPGPRPPLGVLVFEDGSTFALAQDYVVGRQPEVSDLVRDGLALPLPVDDPERSISRAHAELRLVDWDVHLINLSGTNGSFVWDENQQQWIPIPPGQSVVLAPGMRVALGRRSAVFESSLVR